MRIKIGILVLSITKQGGKEGILSVFVCGTNIFATNFD
jgi:hypothetical protein